MKRHELDKLKNDAERLAQRFMTSGVEYTCGAVVIAWLKNQPDHDRSWRVQRMTWDRVHELTRMKK